MSVASPPKSPTGNSSSKAKASASGVSRSEERAPGTLTRQDIAQAIFELGQGFSRREAKRLVDGVIEEMAEALSRGESLKLHEFGSFLVRDKSERNGRNPRTGEIVPIEKRRTIMFRASPSMKAMLNGEAGAAHEPETDEGYL